MPSKVVVSNRPQPPLPTFRRRTNHLLVVAISGPSDALLNLCRNPNNVGGTAASMALQMMISVCCCFTTFNNVSPPPPPLNGLISVPPRLTKMSRFDSLVYIYMPSSHVHSLVNHQSPPLTLIDTVINNRYLLWLDRKYLRNSCSEELCVGVLCIHLVEIHTAIVLCNEIPNGQFHYHSRPVPSLPPTHTLNT